MLYINDPDTTAMTYSAVVKAVTKSGIESQRAYMYLAAIGINGQAARIKLNDGPGYGPIQKMAVRGTEFINDVSKCSHCSHITIK